MISKFRSSVAAAFGSFLLGVSLTGEPQRDITAFSHAPAPAGVREEVLTDEDRYEIILTVLRTIDPKADHVMTRSEDYHKVQGPGSAWIGGDIVYLSKQNLPKIAVERLPKEKFRYKLILRDKGSIFDKADYSYLEFSRLSWIREAVVFTQTAYFRGGNIGGCMEKYSRNGRSWKREKPDCFAMAS